MLGAVIDHTMEAGVADRAVLTAFSAFRRTMSVVAAECTRVAIGVPNAAFISLRLAAVQTTIEACITSATTQTTGLGRGNAGSVIATFSVTIGIRAA